MNSQRTSPNSPSRIAVPGGPEARAAAAEAQSYTFGPFRLVPGERILRRGNQVLPLPPKAFETLLLLVRNPGHLMRKEDLMTALWSDSFVEEGSLTSQISLLRKVLADAGAARRLYSDGSETGVSLSSPGHTDLGFRRGGRNSYTGCRGGTGGTSHPVYRSSIHRAER